jgi:uncharacterized membrane protein YdjX (TVP38/TMEM64 family)
MLALPTIADVQHFLEQFRTYGPLLGLLLAFSRSYIPFVPTFAIVTINAALYGYWLGSLYTLVGLVTGSVTFFLLFRRWRNRPFFVRKFAKPRIQTMLKWVQRRGALYIFLVSLFPGGPFEIINLLAAAANMRLRRFALAITAGRAIMVAYVAYLGQDWQLYFEDPKRLIWIGVLFVVFGVVGYRVDRYFARSV